MTRRVLLLALPLFGLIIALAAWGWMNTPEGTPIPVHWGLDGQPDRYGGKAEAFLTLPVIALGVSGLLLIAPLIDPRGRNLQRSPGLILTALIGTLAILAIAQGGITLYATGQLDDSTGALLPRLLGGVLGLFLIALGNVFGKARPNWFIGIRTPWSLSSDRAWDVSHRWAGRLFVLAGLAGAFASVIMPAGVGLAVLVGGAGLASIIPAIISLLVWRADPDRETYNQTDEDDAD